jgi:hypothetical protein
MSCPFDYKRRERFSFGVAGEFVDYCAERDDEREAAFNERYPTCWQKFLAWLRGGK